MLKHTAKAGLYDYHGWELWIPHKAVIKLKDGPYLASLWAVDTAKEYVLNEERRGTREGR